MDDFYNRKYKINDGNGWILMKNNSSGLNCGIIGWKGGEKWLRNWFLVGKNLVIKKF